MQHEFETTRLAVFIQICAFQISINNTQIKGKIHVNMTRLVALSGQFLCVYINNRIQYSFKNNLLILN